MNIVPTVDDVKHVYGSLAIPAQGERWDKLLSAFKERFGADATVVARSPGRVNLIGEHIDYSEFAVLPMSISADVLIAFRALKPDAEGYEPKIALANVSDKFPEREVVAAATPEDVEIDASKPEWSNYFKAGLHGTLELLQNKYPGKELPKIGMQVVVDGTVPLASGLSSSAAMVCTSALACLVAYGEKDISKHELAQLAVVSERAVGVNSGGMDQMASVFGMEGNALFVEFKPNLDATPLQFPRYLDDGVAFVIANTLVTSVKHLTAPRNYNLRVVECTIAAEILARKLQLGELDVRDGFGGTLRDVMVRQFRGTSVSMEDQFVGMLQIVEKQFPKPDGYTRQELASMMGCEENELVEKYMTRFPVEAERFQLRDRALHVYSEAARVLQFRSAIQSTEAISTDDFFEKLGGIMNASQASCRDLYNCSVPEIDEICQLALESGAEGARLTGAGWGGCCVFLVRKSRADELFEKVKAGYYRQGRFDDRQAEVDEACFATEPASGAVLYRP